MYWFIGEGVNNSTDIMVEATAFHTIEFTCLDSCHSSSGDVFLDRYACWGNCKFLAFLYLRLLFRCWFLLGEVDYPFVLDT